jgi:arsenate reductase
MKKLRVLFLCTGNTARSQMAEAFLRYYAGMCYSVFSAGLEPSVINPFTIQVMEERGIDMSRHFSKGLDTYLGKENFDYVITVCDQAAKKCPYFPGTAIRLAWSFNDPAAVQGTDVEKLEAFRTVRDQIERKILEWIK